MLTRVPMEYPNGKKTCHDCLKLKLLSEFNMNSKGRPAAYCKPCNNRRTAVIVMRKKSNDEIHDAIRTSKNRLSVAEQVAKERGLF